MVKKEQYLSSLEKSLRPGSYIQWRGHTYCIQPYDATEALTIDVKDIVTGELFILTIDDLLSESHDDKLTTIFAPTLELLRKEIESYLPQLEYPPDSGIPDHLLKRADYMLSVVENVEQLIEEEQRRALLYGQDFHYVPALKRACLQQVPPIGMTTFYDYRKRIRLHRGNREALASSLHRITYGQVPFKKVQLHFIDTLITRYYAGRRTIKPRPSMLYNKIGRSILQHTNNLWIDPEKCNREVPYAVVEDLLNHKLPMQVLRERRDIACLLTEMKLPEKSWFYDYLRWFENNPDRGEELIVSRHGREMWEREHMVFDTFATRATFPLQYVFGDHYLLDVFTVDEASRSRVDRLWLTILIDTFSRSILGMALLYETPCIESIQGALLHAIWHKTSHKALGLEFDWPCYGIPQQLSLDNAWAHHSHSLENIARSIADNGRFTSIDLAFRPPYKGRYGALIERLFGNRSSSESSLNC